MLVLKFLYLYRGRVVLFSCDDCMEGLFCSQYSLNVVLRAFGRIHSIISEGEIAVFFPFNFNILCFSFSRCYSTRADRTRMLTAAQVSRSALQTGDLHVIRHSSDSQPMHDLLSKACLPV